MNKILTKAMIATSIAGIVGFGTLTFNDGGIDTIKEKFDYLKQNYENALVTINNYKDVLAQKVKDIKGYEAIQDDLLAQIDDLKAQIKVLEEQGVHNEENEALIAQYEQQIAELEAKLQECATEEDVNSLLAEIERLQGELTKANNRVAELEQYASSSANITPTEALSVEQIMANYDTRNPLLTFETTGDWSSMDSLTKRLIVETLDNLAIPDSWRGSPVLLTLQRFTTGYADVSVSDETAYARITSNPNYLTDYGFYIDTETGEFLTQEQAMSRNYTGVLQLNIQYIAE